MKDAVPTGERWQQDVPGDDPGELDARQQDWIEVHR
jgi:hypothetical protein